jgi:hypothetical protein
MGSQVCFPIVQADFISETIPVDIDGALGYIQDVGDLLTGFSFFDEIGDLDFCGGQMHIFR